MPTLLAFNEIRDKINQLITECEEKQSIEKALWENEKKYRLLTDFIDHGVIVVQDGMIKESNNKLSEISGFPLEQIYKTPLSNMLLGKQDHNDNTAMESFHAHIRRKDGEMLHVSVQKCHMTYQKKAAELLIIKNPISSNHLEEMRSLESIAALSGGIAHDYNNLLTVIIGNLSLVKSATSNETSLSPLIKEALEASNMAKALTQRLITFSKGGSPIKKSADIERLIRQSAEFALSGSNVRCEYDLLPSLKRVLADKIQIGQAIHHLITNAVEAMPTGGTIALSAKNITIEKDASALCPGEYVIITIKDHGKGIPPSIMDKIFTPYFSTKERGDEKGMGLGLSIARSIIKKHGGTIDVRSIKGAGSEFSIYLPSHQNDVIDHDSPLVEDRKESAPIRGTGRILLMDDETMVRELASNILTHLGYDVRFSKDGNECIEMFINAKASGQPFDMVILDLTIKGGMGGKETVREIKKISPEVKCIVSSGYSTDPVLANYSQYGFDGAVPKPYNVYQLSKEINDVFLS